ncbi:MAG: SCO family protein [Pseudomonadota bacterium]
MDYLKRRGLIDPVVPHTMTKPALLLALKASATPTLKPLLAIAALALTFAASLALPILSSPSYGLETHRPAPDFSLVDADGKTHALGDFGGRYIYLMFGYLNCPRVCHTQALLFEQLAHELRDEHGLTFLYLAMDPRRDSAEDLRAYFDERGTNFLSLRDTDERAVQAIAQRYYAFFNRRAPNVSSPDYLIDHTGLFYLIDPNGQLRYTYSANQNVTPRLLEDFHELSEEFAAQWIAEASVDNPRSSP